MSSKASVSMTEFSSGLSRLSERVDRVIQQYGLDEHALRIIAHLPEEQKPVTAKDFRRLRRIQAYQIARSRHATVQKLAVRLYLIWKPLPQWLP